MTTHQDKNFVVAKFGGTSMGSAHGIRCCYQVILDRPSISLVVVSATSGSTNQLLQMADEAAKGSWTVVKNLLEHFYQRHHQLLVELLQERSVSFDQWDRMKQKLDDLLKHISSSKHCSSAQRDEVASFGERFSSLIFSLYLESTDKRTIKLNDVREVLVTDEHFGQATPDIQILKQRCTDQWKQAWENDSSLLVITQGFIGKTLKGETTTLGRGGSDFSAALLAEALEATHLEIWTDVDGVLTLDPKVGAPSRILHELTYFEAAELANLGAKVLHPLTLIPTLRQQIPVYVGNTFSSTTRGTWIQEATVEQPLIRAIAHRTRQGILTLSKIKTPETQGFLAQIFNILAKHRLSVDLITTSEISTALTFHDGPHLNQDLMYELSLLADITWETGLSLISVIGPDLVGPSGVAAKIFHEIQDTPLRFICMGSGKNNISFLVKEERAQDVLLRLHKAFLE